ncbi:MAG TPA: hypothetical protein QF905_07425 [Acidimicrobiales bacterium]|jgi:hypothetical protein|nr:hypothetical protein [Acidimicrobiales bacterium]MDP6214974.1 hypothetical protein [Acidimicrobiales bacterium]MDP7210075.1 hypothetical protein [Acidimicrobiales bacterium]HJL90151.1 hypothetical protein [Acidimicrobiales bacterium]HJO98993.1 hypothetical protein [Acidimicrobiales bacterium]|tara:strand:+ start:3496 stop:3882 length:387 start_codon:yes stop_codon:yes gene_type:complete
MTRTIDRSLPIKRHKSVVATVDLPGVPEGTRGKVKVANGFSWYRYWVSFDNGIDLGQVSHDNLVHAGDWKRYQVDRVEAERLAAEAPEVSDSETTDAGAEAAAAGGNSHGIPEHLLERSRTARERLGA